MTRRRYGQPIDAEAGLNTIREYTERLREGLMGVDGNVVILNDSCF